MCELFAMSSRHSATVNFSLGILASHGGGVGPHKDGWGIAYYEDKGLRLIKEADAASESDWIGFIESHDLRSRIVVSHIRKATVGRRVLENTQPFCRELGGRWHIFAHNGDLKHIRVRMNPKPGVFRPVGTTDSEYAFCALMTRMKEIWLSAKAAPPIDERMEIVTGFAADLRSLGPANFLYSDGVTLFAHGHMRRHTDQVMRPPGLCLLHRSCPFKAPDQASGVRIDSPDQEIALLASVPLTEEAWTPLAKGEVIALEDGAVITRARVAEVLPEADA